MLDFSKITRPTLSSQGSAISLLVFKKSLLKFQRVKFQNMIFSHQTSLTYLNSSVKRKWLQMLKLESQWKRRRRKRKFKRKMRRILLIILPLRLPPLLPLITKLLKSSITFLPWSLNQNNKIPLIHPWSNHQSHPWMPLMITLKNNWRTWTTIPSQFHQTTFLMVIMKPWIWTWPTMPLMLFKTPQT